MASNPNQFEGRRRLARSSADSGAPVFDTLRSITRLIVGGVILGVDEFTRRLPEWEQEATQVSFGQGKPEPAAPAPGEVQKTQFPDTPSDKTRYAVVGLLFESQSYLSKGVKALGRFERAVWRSAAPVRKPVENSRMLAPARRRYERLVERGEAEVARWVETGRVEETHSRALAQTALGNTIYESVGQVVQDPRLRDVVQETSVTLGGEAADGVRGRTLTADTLVEGVARRLFRRAPREFPAEPPITILAPNKIKGD